MGQTCPNAVGFARHNPHYNAPGGPELRNPGPVFMKSAGRGQFIVGPQVYPELQTVRVEMLGLRNFFVLHPAPGLCPVQPAGFNGAVVAEAVADYDAPRRIRKNVGHHPEIRVGVGREVRLTHAKITGNQKRIHPKAGIGAEGALAETPPVIFFGKRNCVFDCTVFHVFRRFPRPVKTQAGKQFLMNLMVKDLADSGIADRGWSKNRGTW